MQRTLQQCCLQGTAELPLCSFKESLEQPLNYTHDEAEPASLTKKKKKSKKTQSKRASVALKVVFQGNLITNRLLLSGPFGLRPVISESTAAHSAEVSLRLMIMNYAEGHILLVTSHFQFPSRLPSLVPFFPLLVLLANNTENECQDLHLLTFYFPSLTSSQ